MIQSTRRSRRSTVLSAAALTVTATMLLVGCSRSDTTDEAASPAPAISDAPATGELTVWADSTDAEPLQDMADAFEAANPDASVTITNVPYDDYTTKLTTAISGGSVPDMALVGSQKLPGLFATGAFEAVPSGLVDPSSFYTAANDAVAYDGVATAVPFYVDTRPLIYNKTEADAAGVEAPKTWDDYISFAKAMEAAGSKKGIRIETGEEGSTAVILTDMMWQAGAELLSDDGAAWTFDTPEVLAAYEQYSKFFTEDVAPNPGPEYGTIDAGFVNNDFAAYISAAASLGFINDAGGADFVEKNVGVTTLPAGPGGTGASVLDGKNWVVFKDAANTDTAWKFAQFLADPEQQAAFFTASGGALPAVQSTYELPALTAQPLLSVFSDQLALARATPAVTTWAEIQTEIQAAAERVSSGSMSPADSVKELQSRADAIGVGE